MLLTGAIFDSSRAQEIIDGGDHEIVGGSDATQAAPWDLSSTDLRVGDTGQGMLTIEEGGAVTSARLVVGNSSASQGDVTVTGEGSNLEVGDDLVVGEEGQGTLIVEDGGETFVDGSVILGELSASEGSLTVAGEGSSMEVGDDLVVGEEGQGILIVEDGGEMSLSGLGVLTIGALSDSEGSLTVTGEGSSKEEGQELIVCE
ncbi:MAG: hypothetical protein K5905_03960 [Roseibium sp.]|uniref:hypothetical protein n=1 Tax=Roseibium sp. TaxID=1936156 RepID=UPI00261DFA7D|nr:hypothetical protein [Roseibium sp.]MCV0424603.1 hypothetical protein [Roseibium sp.]